MPNNTTLAPARSINLTREWVIDHLVNHGLDRTLAKSLHRRFPSEDYDDLLGHAGEVLARWAANDSLRSHIEAGNLTVNMVKRWTRQKWVGRMTSMGCEPLHRMHGKRSEVEIEANRFAGVDLTTMSSDAITSAGDSPDVVAVYDEKGVQTGTEVVDTSPCVDDLLDHHRSVAMGRRYVAATFRDAADRYISLFDAIFVNGESREQIAEREGCTVQRVSQLTTKVRNSVRNGQVIVDDARDLFAYLSQNEAGAEWSALARDLRLDKPRLNRAVAYLAQDGIAVEREDDHYSLTAG